MKMNREQATGLFTKLEIPLRFGGDGVSGWVRLDGKKEVPLRFPNANFELSEHVRLGMQRSLLLNEDEFRQLYSCTLSFKEYLILLRQRLAPDRR